MDRVSDKESFIRNTALIGLSNLLPSEDPSQLAAGTATISEVLLYTLCYDSSPEVRRVALLHTPVTPKTLTAILSRSRDVDPLTRKLLYSSVLSTNSIHPRALSISQREQLVKDGLGDREDAVRVAAGKMVSSWYDIVTDKEAGIIEFLKLFDVVGPEFQVAIDALLSLFVTVPDTLSSVNFDGKLRLIGKTFNNADMTQKHFGASFTQNLLSWLESLWNILLINEMRRDWSLLHYP
jgi:condensin complex subunit 3